ATALVHEAFARLAGDDLDFESREHFLTTCARTMRRVLVESARRKACAKRALRHVAQRERIEADPRQCVDHLVLDELLTTLGELDPRLLVIVELRFFAGLTIPEVAQVLGLSPKTVEADWTFARSWLARKLGSDAPSALAS